MPHQDLHSDVAAVGASVGGTEVGPSVTIGGAGVCEGVGVGGVGMDVVVIVVTVVVVVAVAELEAAQATSFA